jgi:hypothetical protein
MSIRTTLGPMFLADQLDLKVRGKRDRYGISIKKLQVLWGSL